MPVLQRQDSQDAGGHATLAVIGAAASWLIAGTLFNRALVESSTQFKSWQLPISYALAASGSSLLIWAMLNFDGGYDSRWAIHLGRISYGMYVFHSFVIELFARIPLSKIGFNALHSHLLRAGIEGLLWIVAPLLVTWALAELSYRFFERPFLRLKDRFAVIVSEPHEAVEKSAAAAFRSRAGPSAAQPGQTSGRRSHPGPAADALLFLIT